MLGLIILVAVKGVYAIMQRESPPSPKPRHRRIARPTLFGNHLSNHLAEYIDAEQKETKAQRIEVHEPVSCWKACFGRK